MKNNPLLVLSFLLAGSISAFAQDPAPKPNPDAKPENKETVKAAAPAERVTVKSKFKAADYDAMLEKVRSGDMSVNFAAMRLAYTETKDYAPYGGAQARGQMYRAFGEKNHKEALSIAGSILKTNFVDLPSQFISWKCNEATGDAKAAGFHEKVFKALWAAINEFDGLSESTAMISIGISEQYFVMNYLGFERGSKGLVQKDGSIFDVHTVTNQDTNETRMFYFNIDKVFGRF